VKNKRGWHDVLIRWRTKGGGYRGFESNASPIFDGTGKLVGFQGVDRDVTERKQAEEEREKLADQNRQLQKTESLSRMAGAIAHHFNNQLAAVMMNLEMAMSELPRQGELFEQLSESLQSARNAAAVSTQMLTYLGQTSVHREPLDLTTVCQRHLPVIQAALPTNVVLELDLPTPGPTVVASANHMQQILTNLVTNAWEASAGGQGKIRVNVKIIFAADIPAKNRFPVGWQPQDTGYACLEVADAGCGIAPHDVEKVFDPFFSTKFTGRGLGLPVVLGIVRAQHGVITVESKPGCGSCFRIFIPVATEAVPRKSILVTQPSKPAGSGSLLVVEDEPSVRKAAALAFRRLGYTVLTAQDGVEAVAVFQTHRDEISCVLCDLSMPRMNGWETLSALRKLVPGIPVILASGYSETQVLAGEHPELPQAFLSKPYNLEKLKATLARVLGKG
jgi:signal transduction histidine kinase/ActR/RegA family two-component response regulator